MSTLARETDRAGQIYRYNIDQVNESSGKQMSLHTHTNTCTQNFVAKHVASVVKFHMILLAWNISWNIFFKFHDVFKQIR